MKLKFITSRPVASDVVSFIFQSEQPVQWLPGQYFHYILPHPDADDRGTERWFTNAASPSEDHIMISTRIASDHGSSFKKALQQLKPGDYIEADGPEGDFTIEDTERNYIFIAGGIGITPFRSILTEADKQGMRLKATLLYANRDAQIPFSEELNQLADHNPELKIAYVTQPARIDAELLAAYVRAVQNPIVYISGPEPMVKAFADLAAGLGLSKDDIKTDDFPGYEAD